MSKPQIALEKVECRDCLARGAPCHSCNDTGFIGYLITESQVLQLVEALGKNKTFPAMAGMDAYMGVRYTDDDVVRALSILVRKP